MLVDWPWAAAGAPVLDVVALAPSAARGSGGDPEDLLQATAAGRSADPDAVTALVAAFCGRMEEHARRPPLPALPGVRHVQRVQADVSRAWLAARTGWVRAVS